MINYGLMLGEPIQIDAFQCVFRDIHLAGIWPAKLMCAMPSTRFSALFARTPCCGLRDPD